MLITAQHKNTEWAINKVLLGFEDMMASLDNQYLRERSGDISEIRRRLLNLLDQYASRFHVQGSVPLPAGNGQHHHHRRAYQEMIVNMRMDQVLGFVTEHGGVTRTPPSLRDRSASRRFPA